MEADSQTPERLPLLYVEDEQDIAEMVIEVLSEHYDVTYAKDGKEGLDFALHKAFSVMVIDRRLPGVSGTELIGQVRTAGKTTPILLLTALGTVDDKVYGLDSGANDYLVKPFDFAELLARLRSLVRAFTITHKGRYIGEWLFTPDQNLLFSPFDQRITLTAQENRLLELLSSAPDHVFSREEILSAAFPGGESKAAVETYVHYVRAKATPGIIETIRGRGYRLGDQP